MSDKVYVRVSGTAERFNHEGQIYEKGRVYGVPETRAEILIRKHDHWGRPFFSILTNGEVEELTGVRLPPKEEAAKLAAKVKKARQAQVPMIHIETKKTHEEEEAQLAKEREVEAAALDQEPDITDKDIQVFGKAKKKMELFTEDHEFTDI